MTSQLGVITGASVSIVLLDKHDCILGFFTFGNGFLGSGRGYDFMLSDNKSVTRYRKIV